MQDTPSPDADTGAALADVTTLIFDGHGGAAEIDAEAFAALDVAPGDGTFAWQHLRKDFADTPRLLAATGLDAFVIAALTAEETRPRCTVHGDGVLLNLRGVNLAPSAEPEDMVSVRLWLETTRIVGVSVRPLIALSDLMAATARGQAPVSPGEFVAKLALRLADRAEPAVGNLNEGIDDIEEAMLVSDMQVPRARLAVIRRAAILLRRHLVPQRDALTTLEIEDVSWLRERDRVHLREAADRVVRLGEELDAIRDRAQVIHDELLDQRSESLNRRMLILAVVTTVFLPLGLFTGLLGINVGGIPGAGNPYAFAIVCGLLAVIGVAAYALFRALGMFR